MKQQHALFEMLDLAGAFKNEFFHSFNQGCGNNIKPTFDEVVGFLNQQDYKESAKWLRDETQKHFFARTGERWEALTPKWIVDNLEKVIDLLNEVGICDVCNPSHSNYFLAAILGSTKGEMEKRAEWVLELLKNNLLVTDRIYFLVGERYIVNNEDGLNRDGGKEYLKEIAKNQNIPLHKITEIEIATEMGKRLFGPLGYDISLGNKDCVEKEGKQLVILPSCQINGKRPTTESTIRTLTNHLDENGVTLDVVNKDGGIFFISRSPNTYPQREQIKDVLKNGPGFEFEVGGKECTLSKEDARSISSIVHYALMPIAGGIYTIINKQILSEK